MIDNLNILADRLRGIQVNGKDITVEDLKSYISSDEKVEVKSASRINLLTDAEIEEMESGKLEDLRSEFYEFVMSKKIPDKETIINTKNDGTIKN